MNGNVCTTKIESIGDIHMAETILVVDDEKEIVDLVAVYLENENFKVFKCYTAKEALNYVEMEAEKLDLAILDVMLPDESGYDIVKKIRNNPATKKLPVMMVTAKTSEIDMIKGLDDGADDYIKKPFSIMELISRVKALLRRTVQEEVKVLSLEELCIDHERHMVYVKEKAVELTFKEYELLRLLMSNVGVVMSRENIMIHVWGTDFEGESRSLDVHIRSLRQKLAARGNAIETIRNVGYRIG